MTPNKHLIRTLLDGLHDRLTQAAGELWPAVDAASEGKLDLAMGTALALDRLLPEIVALYEAAKTIHRGRERPPTTEGSHHG